ncbi:aminopeptidase [Trichodelitschia bisporula]|uniref:Aminopeptidase n=1 Tax=Trichodelitschia bisporula TaxID=703511 RepID=A0A6G1HML4_9PEZI|nr:aminopeptidase [Trichodelitschia bisporula]
MPLSFPRAQPPALLRAWVAGSCPAACRASKLRLHATSGSGAVLKCRHRVNAGPFDTPIARLTSQATKATATSVKLQFNYALRIAQRRTYCSYHSRERTMSDRDVLPAAVKPTHYALSISNLEFKNWTYQGVVRIDLDIKSAGTEVVLNVHQLSIKSARLDGGDEGSVSYDKENQRVILAFKEYQAGKHVLEVKFGGIMNNQMAGFYRSRYKPKVPAAAGVPRDDEYHYMLSTQFESCDARRAFPCFDEPNLKATFDFEIEIPEDHVALSNMLEKETRKSRDGWKVVSFDMTPVMSTYLLAWAVGDFEYIESFTEREYNGKKLPVRVYTTRGLKEQGRYALEHAGPTVDYFSKIFRIDYPLPKVDLLAVHEFSLGAMENWGLITYRTTALLFDEKQSDQRYKNRIAYLVAHELAHQWFGNLVTMDWWSELWLNEGFATWVGWLAVDHLHPEWNVWAQFVSESLQTAFQLDSIRNSHPIEVPVRNALEVDQIFDHISYLKGSSVIRMLSAHLGTETFLLGVSNYLKAHKYSNATTNDLWSALSSASGQDVNAFMDPWIRKIGFPVVTLTEEPNQLTVSQARFLLTGDVKPEEDETTWWIPLGLKEGGKTAAEVDAGALTAKKDVLRTANDEFYKLNVDQNGFYRTNYPAARLQKLGAQRAQLSTEDRIGLVGDAAALAQSGDGTTAAFLAMVEGFGDEKEYLVWQQMLSALGHIQSIFADVPGVKDGLRKFSLKLLTPATERVGWTFEEGESLLTGQLRALLIAQAGLAGHEGVIAEAQRQFKEFAKGDCNVIHPSLRSPVFRIAIKAGGREEYEAVKAFYKNTTAVDGKEIALQSMGRVQSAELARDLLNFAFSPAVAVQDRHSVGISLASNSAVRVEVWNFVKENWESKVYPELSGNMVVLERFLKSGLSKFASWEVKKDIEGFFEGKDQRGYDRGLGVVLDTIAGAAKYREREAEGIKEWLTKAGYIQ